MPPRCCRNSDTCTAHAPEKKLTLFALRLAVLEKAASSVGALAFIWATVILLGGFAVTLVSTDFWFVTIILLSESTRIFSRSHELEWQHQAMCSLAESGRRSFRMLKSKSHFILRVLRVILRPSSIKQLQSNNGPQLTDDNHNQKVWEHQQQIPRSMRTWLSPDVPLVPYAGWVFVSRNTIRMLYWLQLFSATACVVLSSMRLIRQDYGEEAGQNEGKGQQKSSLNIFYGLVLAEAFTFLLEKAYLFWKISCCNLLEDVSKKCQLGPTGLVSIRRFFYDTYSKCIQGSIFDGLKMDLISYGAELLVANSGDEQLIGAWTLKSLVTGEQSSAETLRKIGTSAAVMERLVEMLNWKDHAEQDIRNCAAEILSKLTEKKQNALRLAAIPGAIESIASLLYTGRNFVSRPDQVSPKTVIVDEANYDFSAFSLHGLTILMNLARDHDNCEKIRSANSLLPKIIDFTGAGKSLLRNNQASHAQIEEVERSLEVVKMLVITTGSTGKLLRQEISEIVFTVSNIREILRYGKNNTKLQKLGIEILTGLAMDETAREKIGSSGGIIKLLLSFFFNPGLTVDWRELSVEAGEALALLALENEQNCNRILKDCEVLSWLIGELENPVLRINASRILHNLCAYSGAECFDRLEGITAAMTIVLKAIMTGREKLLEVSIGLITQICKFISFEKYVMELEKADIKEIDVVEKLVNVLKEYEYANARVPRIRKFVIEHAIWMMKASRKYVLLFSNFEMEKVLQNVEETISEIESFNIFSGTVGLSYCNASLIILIHTALQLITTEEG
ncbi:hypothetical protein COCNU_02G017490 [Cocos nucifera]|uniref:ARM repeat superfamily protein n=1 Tax=Cocos nucifera TaxID=13894 RepID=A0A8K0I0Q1_COCNU|nr:hypothetical protein COCNU_02G017490 [Cocos nucifera]